MWAVLARLNWLAMSVAVASLGATFSVPPLPSLTSPSTPSALHPRSG